MNTPQVLISVAIGSFLIVLTAIIGLVLLALHYPSVVDLVIPVLSGVLAGLITAVTAVLTHLLGGVQEQQRIVLSRSTNGTPIN